MFEDILNEHQSRADRLQLAALCGLIVVGTAFVYSATMANESAALLPLYNQLWFRQIIWYALGLGAGTAVCFLDYRILARWSVVVYGATLVLLVAVLIPGIGTTHGWGARRWCRPKKSTKSRGWRASTFSG